MKFVYSHGGYAREFIRCIREQFPGEEIHFVDDNPSNGAISYQEACALDPERQGSFVIGFAGGKLRADKTKRVGDDGFDIFSVCASSAIIGDNVTYGDGSIISDFATLTADAQIGLSFQCNIYSYVAHDCVIGDYVTLAPRVSVNGRVRIGDHAYIGTGATILPGKEGQPIVIGENAVVGAHALVTRDVPPNTTVVGTPAKARAPKA